MLRRTFLNALAALPVVSVPERLSQPRDASSTTITVEQEDDMWFWYYVYSASQTKVVMSTARSREHAVNEMQLTVLSERQAREILRRANDGEFGPDDMPDRWRRVLADIHKVEFV